MNIIRSFYVSARLLRMHDPFLLPLGSKYHMFCTKFTRQSRVYKIGVRHDLQNIPKLLLTVSLNLCNPWAFQLMVYKCGRLMQNATET